MSKRNSKGELAKPATNKRLAYTLAAGAVVASSQNAHAEVVYSGIADITVNQGNSLYLYLDDDIYKDVLLKNYVFTNGNYQGIYLYYPPGRIMGFRAGPSNFSYAAALTAGTFIDAATPVGSFVASLSYGAKNPNGQFNDIADAYIGLKFPIGGATVSDLHFGWLRVDIDNAEGTFIIRDWAYESDAGVGIEIGDIGPASQPGDFDLDGDVDGNDFLLWQRGGSPTATSPADLQAWQDNYGTGPLVATTTAVPEPFTLGLLACGSAGLLMLRRAYKR